MRLSRAIPVLVAGAAAVWFLDRRRLLPGQERPALPWPPDPTPAPEPPEPVDARAEPEPEDGPPAPAPAPEPEQAQPEPEPEVAPPAPEPEAVPAEPEPEEVPAEPEPEPEVAPPEPEPESQEAPPEPEPEPEDAPPPAPDFGFTPSEQPTTEQPALEIDPEPEPERDPFDVTAVVDDLIAPAGDGGDAAIVDAEVVDDAAEEEPQGPTPDERIAQIVREELAKIPEIPAGAVTVEVLNATVILRGKIDRPGTISELDRVIRDLGGVVAVRNLLHLPGTPPPT